MTKEELKEYEKMAAQMDADAAAIKKQREEERNKVTSYSVMTTDKETGERVVQTYTGDDAAVAKKEAEARKKKYGGNADLTDLLTPKATKKTSTAAKTQAATKAKTSTAPKAEEKTSTAPVTTGDLKKQLTAKERAAAKAQALYMEGDTATQNTNLSAKNLAEAEKTMLKNAAAARSEEKKAANAEQKAAEIYFEDEANAEPYYIDKERKAMQAAADEAAKAFVKSGAGAPNLSVPTFAEKGVKLERKTKAEAADAAMRAQKDEDLLGPEWIKRKTEAEAKAAKARQNQTLAQIDLATLESRRAALEKEIEKAGDLTTADIKAAQAAAGKGARYGDSTTAAAYREQQEKIRALQAAMTELDGEIDRVKAAQYYYSIPRRSDFEETAKKGKEQFYTGEALENDTEKLRYKELLDAGADPEIIEGGNGYFGGPMLNLYTEEEKKIYYYLYATDKEAAAEFWEIANRRVAEDQRDQKYQEVYDLANRDKTGILPTVFNVAAGTVSGLDEVGNLLDYTLEGKLRPKLGISGAVDASTEAVTEDMSDTGKFLYGTGLSIANNVALVGTLGSLAGLPMALSAAAGATNDALARGATDEEALAFGVASGIAEAAFEKISIEKLITLRDSRTGRQLIRNAMIQGGIEASEEAMTSIANTVSDAMIMGDKAELINMVGAYIDQGYSDEEAEKLAFRDWWGNIGLDALGGFISGGVLGGGTVVLNRIENRLQTRSEADLSQINRAIEERAEQSEKGMTGAEIEKTGKAIQKILEGKLITETEDKAMMQSPAAQEVFAEITGTDYVSGERVARDILRDMTGIEAKAAQSGESLTEWDRRTAPKEKAPEAKATDALGELTGLKAGPTKTNEDLDQWNQRTQEEAKREAQAEQAEQTEQEKTAKPKPSENWRQNVTKKKAAEIDEAVTMGERRGNKVVVTTEIPGEGRHDPDGTIYLNPNAEHPVRQVLVHEFTHDIETSKVYERFSKAVLDIAEKIDGADIAQMKEQIRLEEPGLNDPGIERELVARIAGSRLFSDQNMVNRLFDTDQTVFRKIKNWISDALTKVFGSEERKELLRAEKLYLRAMNSRGQVDGYGKEQNSIQNIVSDSGKNYGIGVYLDSDLLTGLSDGDRKKMVKEFVKTELAGKSLTAYDKNGNPVNLVVAKNNEKFIDKNGIKRKVNKELYHNNINKDVKQETVVLIDELLETANKGIPSSAKYPHDWLDNYGKNKWDYWTTYIQDKNNAVYKATLNVANAKDGRKILYDIDPIKKVAAGAINSTPTTVTVNSISNSAGNVNTQNTEHFKGSSYEDMLEAQNRRTDGRTANEIISDIEETFENGVEMRDQARAVLNRLSALTQEREKQITEDEIEGRTIIGERTAPEVKTGRAKKSIDIQRRYERELRGTVGNIFGVDGGDLRGDIAGIVSEMADTVHEGGKVTDEQYERLLTEAVRLGWTEVAGNAGGEYDDARDFIKTTPIYLDRGAVEDLGGKDALREFQKEAYGSVKLTTNIEQKYEGKAVSIDDVYKTMTQFDRSFFPEDVTDPVEQLERIRDFMEETKTRRVGLTEVYGGDSDFMDWAKGQLAVAVQNLENKMGSVAAYDREKTMLAEAKAKQFNKDANFEDARAAANSYELYEAEKAVSRIIERNDFTAEDRLAVKNLLAGTLTEERFQQNPTANPEGVIELYHAEQKYNRLNKPIEDFKAAIKEARTEEARNALKNSDRWNDKAAGIRYSVNTEERNVRDIVGNKAEADGIIRTYFEPVHRNEAMKNRWIAEVDQRIKDIIGKHHMNQWERAYTQMLGENASFLAEGKATKRTRDHENVLKMMDDILRDHGKEIDVNLCERVAAEMMDIYNECHERYNDEMIRNGRRVMGHVQNYFPHFSIKANETLAAKILGFLGIETENSVLPTEIAGRTADRKPGTRYNRFTQERTTDVTDYDAIKGFDMYISAMAENLYHTEDIGRLRALATELREKYSSVDVAAQVERVKNDDSLTEEEKASQIDGIYEAAKRDKYQLSNFAVHLDEYINGLAGKKSFGDREMEYEAGRTMYDISKALEGTISGGMVGYNVSTAKMNLVPLFQAVTELRPDEILTGIFRTVAGNLRGDNFAGQSDFLTNRRSDGRSTVYKDNYNLFTAENFKEKVTKARDGGGLLMNFIDAAVSESLVRAKVAKNLRNGMTEDVAFREADSWAAGLMADRSEGAVPTIFNRTNPVTKLFTTFQIEQINQFEHILKDSMRDKWDDDKLGTIVGLAMAMIASWVGNKFYNMLLGRDNALPDPIGLTEKSIKAIKKGRNPWDVAAEAGLEIVEQIPFIGGLLGGGRIPIASALPDISKVLKVSEGISENGFGKKEVSGLANDVFSPILYFLPGGSQLRKTVQGAAQIANGGNYGYDAEGNPYLKYLQGESFYGQLRNGEKPTMKGAANDLQTLLFGRWSGDNAREYLDGGKALSAKKTAMFEEATKGNIDKEAFYDFLLGADLNKKNQTRQELLRDQRFSGGQKNRIDQILFPGDEGHREYQSAEAYIRSGLTDKEAKAFDAGVDPEELAGWKKLNDYLSGDGKTIEFIRELDKAEYLTPKQKQAVLDAVTDKTDSVFTDDTNRNEEFYKALGLTAKERDEARIITAISGNQEEQIEALKKAGYSEEKATEIVKANSWRTKEDSTAENYASTGLSDKDQYRLYNILQTTEGKEAQVTAIAEAFGVSEREAGDLRHKAKGEWINSVEDLNEGRTAKLPVFERFKFTEEEVIAGYNGICGMSKKTDKIAALTEVFIERGDSPAAAKKKASNFYNIAQGNNGYQ